MDSSDHPLINVFKMNSAAVPAALLKELHLRQISSRMFFHAAKSSPRNN
jgi:hypothetical protein